MKKMFLVCASVFFSTLMFAQVMIWNDGEVIYRKNIDEVDRISFYEVADFSLLKDTVELDYYGDWQTSRKWIHAEFEPKNSYGVLEYTSSDESVVTVSYDGYLIAKGVGEATVTVKMLGTEIVKTCKVIVNGFSGTFTWGEIIYLAPKQYYSLTYYPNLFDPYCLECVDDLEWKSSNETVAVVNEDGFITAKTEGEAVITATLKGTELSASAIVVVDDPEMNILVGGEDSEEVKIGKKGTKYLQLEFKNSNFDVRGYYFFIWESTNENVVTFRNYDSYNCYNEIVAVEEGEADVIVRLRGTDVRDTIRVVVTPTDPMTVEFRDVLFVDNLRGYPLGYDSDNDGKEDEVREIDLWILGTNLVWDDVYQTMSGEDYVIYVKTACVYTGSAYNVLGEYNFTDIHYVSDYLTEYGEEIYFISNRAAVSYLDSYYYCRYYEKLAQSDTVNREAFVNEFGNWPFRDFSSYIYYWDADNNNAYLSGLVNWGKFEIDYNMFMYDPDRGGNTELRISYMDAGVQFFTDSPNGLLTEMQYDEATGEEVVVLATPYQMASFIGRNIYIDNRYYFLDSLGAPMQKQGVSEKALAVNKMLNFPLQMKLQSINF